MSLPGRLVELPLGRVYVHQGGSGPPLVLLHGMFVSHYYYRAVAPELAKRFSVTAIDLYGFGESDRPPPARYDYGAASAARVVGEAMDALGIPSAHVVGHSMGGGVALALAAHHPERVRRLVLEDAWIYPMAIPLLGKLLLQPLVGSFLFKNLLARRNLVRQFRSVHKNPAVATDEQIDYYWERFNRAGARDAALTAFRAFVAMPDDPGDPRRVRAATLVVWGEEDRLFPLAQGKRLAEEVPGARLAVVPACAHSPHEERPEEFLRAVVPFLDEHHDAASAATREAHTPTS